MPTDPFFESRLLSGRDHLSVLEKDEVLDRVLAATPASAPKRLPWWLFGGVTAAATALIIFVFSPAWFSPAGKQRQQDFSSRGGVQQRLGFGISCVDEGGAERCRSGSSLLFRTWAPKARPYFACFARGDDGTVVWYAPSGDRKQSLDTRLAGFGGVLGQGVLIGDEHRAGQYTVYGLFSETPLSKSEVRAQLDEDIDSLTEEHGLFRVQLRVEK